MNVDQAAEAFTRCEADELRALADYDAAWEFGDVFEAERLASALISLADRRAEAEITHQAAKEIAP